MKKWTNSFLCCLKTQNRKTSILLTLFRLKAVNLNPYPLCARSLNLNSLKKTSNISLFSTTSSDFEFSKTIVSHLQSMKQKLFFFKTKTKYVFKTLSSLNSSLKCMKTIQLNSLILPNKCQKHSTSFTFQ